MATLYIWDFMETYKVGEISRKCKSDLNDADKHLESIVKIVKTNPFVGATVIESLKKAIERVEEAERQNIVNIQKECSALNPVPGSTQRETLHAFHRRDLRRY